MDGGNLAEELILVDGVDLRTDGSELKNMAGIAAIVGLSPFVKLSSGVR